MPYTLDQLNAAPLAEAERMLDGLYEHTPWIAEHLRGLGQGRAVQLFQGQSHGVSY